MDNWYEEMERSEQEYDVKQQEIADAYKSGYNAGLTDGETKACSEGALRGAYEQGKEEGIAKGRAETIDLVSRHLWNYSKEVWEDFKPILEQLKEQKNE